MIVSGRLAQAVAELRAAGVDSAARDARLLIARAMGVETGRLTLFLQDDLDPVAGSVFDDMIRQRCNRVPVSHLIGERAFYGRVFEVSGDVLDPRPETETLVGAALASPFERVLDLGTGSGCILLTVLAETEATTGQGVDLSPRALEVAARNAEALGLGDRVDFATGDWFAPVSGRFDLILSNPPYIALREMEGLAPELAHEPRMALTDEGDGLSAYRIIAAGAGAHLTPRGRLMVEIGPTQGAEVAAMFEGAGFAEVAILPDLDGRDRVVCGRWSG
ncbi:MAG: protein-(glutamine-N5) methyltransferase, release factor-specific [Rhodobacterales bacterium]|nr:MAG: protein-(glutamine-N5) methyltransferase, release factor-specific [Rhodobacterales bacterium]